MNRNFPEIFHSAFSLTALLAIIGFSSFVVMNLNPVAMSEEKVTQGPNVAGVSTDAVPLRFINIANESKNYKTSLVENSEDITYLSDFSGSSNEVKDKFIKVQNTGELNGAFQIEVYVPYEVRDLVEIRISDKDDVIILNNQERKRISVIKNSERNFQISYRFSKPINFDFQIKFDIIN